MYRRGLRVEDIEQILSEDLPSGTDSDVDDYFSDSDQDPIYEPSDKESDSYSDTESDVSDHDVIVPVSAPAPVPVPSSHHQVPVVLPQEPNWSKSESVPPIPNFQGECGVSQHIRDIDNPTPYLLFRELFTDELKPHCVHGQFFSSVDLFSLLKAQNIFAVSTVNPNRKKLPKLKEEKHLQWGEFDAWVCSQGISVYRWNDKRGVNLMSTVHDPFDVMTVTRMEKDGSIVNVPCPKVLKDYNDNMNFVDNFDRLKSDYEIDRKRKKWWHRLFFHFVDCCVVNAFIIHKDLNMEKYSNKNFRRKTYHGLLAKQLVATAKSDRSRLQKYPIAIKHQKPSVDAEIRFEGSKHQPIKTTSRRCALCSTKKKPTRTVWECSTCKVALCLKKKNCFRDYHTK
ncbi:hypothetical protein C0J52_28021 [Blattella germanica]|nr:hypothetical protein C0J52_28021 [Blattella germanica]